MYASTSSVYGANTKMPFSVHQNVDHPLSFYAATKKANELMAHTYAHLYSLPVTGLRFFTVYGPWGRPDMALFLFTRNILSRGSRSTCSITDTIAVISRSSTTLPRAWCRACDRVATAEPRPGTAMRRTRARARAPYRLYNIGNNRPVELLHTSTCSRSASAGKRR